MATPTPPDRKGDVVGTCWRGKEQWLNHCNDSVFWELYKNTTMQSLRNPWIIEVGKKWIVGKYWRNHEDGLGLSSQSWCGERMWFCIRRQSLDPNSSVTSHEIWENRFPLCTTISWWVKPGGENVISMYLLQLSWGPHHWAQQEVLCKPAGSAVF